MPLHLHARHVLGAIVARYVSDGEGGIGLTLVPACHEDALVPPRRDLLAEPEIATLPPAWKTSRPAEGLEPLLQVALSGRGASGGFAQGRTQRDAPPTWALRLVGQTVQEDAAAVVITTRLADGAGLEAEHRLTWRRDEPALRVRTTVANTGSAPVVLELLTSANLGGITPFARDDAPGRLRVHRFRSTWAAEGRLETRTIEELHLERSWIGWSHQAERFGQVGTMPVRGFFPCCHVEDTGAGVTWGLQLCWAGSWQIELHRRHDRLALGGGLADRELGHWTMPLAPGQSFTAPEAWLSCVAGGLDASCDALTALQRAPLAALPTVERDLPIIVNEWCTTWGDPGHDRMTALADRLRGTPARYLVIDAGWYKTAGGDWGAGHGDWIPSPDLFPQGIEATAQAIRDRGLIPGLWFEMETVGSASTAFRLGQHLLTRDGQPITSGKRAFWDLRRPEVQAYLEDRVIGLLERGGFGYLKVDYNDTPGIGCDGDASLGEGLRRQVEGVYRFWRRLRERLPGLVIENCSSGGHRLEPSMLALAAMASFSDAHETREIPRIAAGLHRLVLPRQSQVWAVLHPTDDDRRLDYSLAATFLGRMCLSGDLTDLAPAAWARVEAAMALYQRAAPVIADGTSRRQGTDPDRASWRHSEGWQAVVRQGAGRMLVVSHWFGGHQPSAVRVALPPGAWRIVGSLNGGGHVTGQELHLAVDGPWTARVHLLEV